MNEIINCAMHKNNAILATANGDVYRVWFSNGPFPFIEKLPPEHAKVHFIDNKMIINYAQTSR